MWRSLMLLLNSWTTLKSKGLRPSYSFHRSVTYKIWPSPRPCLDWHSGRSLKLLRESSDHIITERCRPTDWHTKTNSAARFAGWAQQSGESRVKRRVKEINTNCHCGSTGTLDKYACRVAAYHIMGTVHLYKVSPLARSKEWPVFV
jgi:hypothetical protein